MLKVPKWLYAALTVLAVVVVAAKATLVGKVSWLPETGNARQYIEFILYALVLFGFGTAIKEGVKIEEEEPAPAKIEPPKVQP